MSDRSDSGIDGVADLAQDSPPARPPQRGRRVFLGAAGGLAVGGVLGVDGVHADARDLSGVLPDLGARGVDAHAAAPDRKLKTHALLVRLGAAKQQFELPIAKLLNNGDEQRYENKIGSDTRGLPHDERGEVDPTAWALAEQAYRSRNWEDFEHIPLGGSRKFVNPVGTLAVALEGLNVTQIEAPPAPTVASAERAAETVEQYWQAVLRDEPIDGLADSALAAAAARELEGLRGYQGPRVAGRVTPDILFRGTARYADPRDPTGRTAKHVVPPGTLAGPYLSQLVLRETPYGTQYIPAVHRLPEPGQSFLVEHDEWLAIQDGVAPSRATRLEGARRHLRTLRDHGVHPRRQPAVLGSRAAALAPRSGTATAPAGVGAPLSRTNPYNRSRTQAGANATFAAGYLQALLTRGVSHAIRATYFSKFFVHRSVRPEAFGGLVQQHVANGVDYPLHGDLLDSEALAEVQSRFGSAFIPHAYPEGAPLHGSYPAGSAAIAGVSATLLKAFFDESFVIPDAVQVDPSDPSRLVPYQGATLTVGGELNKLALNATFGRVLSGIHWRSDAAAGLVVGEQIAVGILRDERLTFAEPFDGFTLTRFDGTTITV